MKRTMLAAAAAVALFSAPAAMAQDRAAAASAASDAAGNAAAKPDPARVARARAAFESNLTRRTGKVDLPQAKVSLNLGDRFYYLSPEDSRKVLVQAWGNPPDAANDVLGMIFPTGTSPLDDENWGAVLTYEGAGYVADKDARKLDYAKLLDQMRKGEEEDNAQRQKQGFSAVHLVGWAQPPVYDPARHSLIWARELKFSEAKGDTINYDVRVLGRQGVLSMNIIAGASVMPQLKAAGEELQSVATFDPGSRYADFQKGDKKAAYGLGGLILAGAGIVAAKKIGLIAIGLLVLKKGFVVILAAFGGGAAWVRRKLGLKPKPPRKARDGSESGPIVS